MTAVGYQVMPRLAADEYADLEQSIIENGVQVPITVAPDGAIIDGHHRDEIARKYALHCPRVTAEGSSEKLRGLAFSLNLHRRHLTREQRRALVVDSIKSDPQLSDREHGRRTGVSPTTAGAVRQELESDGLVSKLDTRTGADGIAQPASKPPRPEPNPVAEVCRDCDGYGCETCVPEDIADALDEHQAQGSALEALQRQIDQAPQRKSPEKPITKSFDSATYDLKRVVKRVVNLSENDRFKKNKDQITGANLSDLIRARDALNDVIQQLEG